MGLFRKKESVHFERDEEGQVVQVTRNGQPVDPSELKMKTSEQLEREYYSKHPEKRHPTMRKIGAGVAKLDKKLVDYNRRSNIMNPQRPKRPARPMASFGMPPPSRSNANPFGTMFDTGQPRYKSKKKKSKVQYKVIGGKAYPIAGTGKTKKQKSTKRKHGFGFDPFEGLGW